MKMNRFALASLVLGLTSASLATYADTYMGAQYTHLSYEESGFDEVNPSAINLIGGITYDSGLSLEGRLGFGIADDDLQDAGITIDLELDALIGAYAKYNFLPESTFSPYLIAGVSYVELTASSRSVEISDDTTDLSYGLGADIELSESTSLHLEYMSYTDDFSDNTDVSGISLGFNYHF